MAFSHEFVNDASLCLFNFEYVIPGCISYISLQIGINNTKPHITMCTILWEAINGNKFSHCFTKVADDDLSTKPNIHDLLIQHFQCAKGLFENCDLIELMPVAVSDNLFNRFSLIFHCTDTEEHLRKNIPLLQVGFI